MTAQEQYLAEYYINLFFGNANKRYRSMTLGEMRKRCQKLNPQSLKGIEKSNELSDVHAMLSKVCAYLMRKEDTAPPEQKEEVRTWIKKMKDFCVCLAGKDLEFLSDLEEEELQQVLQMQGIRRYLLSNSLERGYQLFYIPKTIQKGIRESIKQKPEEEYPQARLMKRKFILHVGPTNSGKTHDALERLKSGTHGAYFGPLRLLALEVYDKCNMEGLPCSMITGEETIQVPGALCQSCTVEMLNDHEYFDIAVVDECQMIGDPYRGHNWTRAILGLRAEEIHLCMAPEAESIITQMIKRCGDQYRILRHKRNTRLTIEKKPYSMKHDLRKGDALIVFSKKSVLALAAHLEGQGVRCSVIYGSLPPATRREQVRRFLAKETDIVVSTDAIGMGLNLPIRRIVFVETQKFDGVAKRDLEPGEIKQIAGRAGRFGIYEEGFVAAIDNIQLIEDGLGRMPIPIMKALIGFPEQLLNLPADIDSLIKIWAGMDAPALYQKMEVDELLSLYQNFLLVHGTHMEEFSKHEIYKLITCAIDINNKMVMDLWKDYCREYREVDELEFPYSPGNDLYDLESYYKMLDLYFQFSRKVGLPVQLENLIEERHETEAEISRILKMECTSYSRKCSICKRELPWDYSFSVCERCFERGKSEHRGRGQSGKRSVNRALPGKGPVFRKEPGKKEMPGSSKSFENGPSAPVLSGRLRFGPPGRHRGEKHGKGEG
ncbi:MAG: helicase [Lachnospiraceae bacterium]|jgi:ATP-dependent RNA helicase SUPV3L1/SUV3|nr:helicase [Lachnospiraceae bacterium]